MKVLSIGVHLVTVATFSVGIHTDLEASDLARDANAAERPVIPRERDTRARAAGIKPLVLSKQIVFELGGSCTRAPACPADRT